MTKEELISIDELNRARVIKELDQNLFIEASAGSGKTSMLVKRMVALVESGVDVDKICTITFTKAAAFEFRDRFQLLLLIRSKEENFLTLKEAKEVSGLPPTTPKSRALCEKALNNLDLCFMGTIDSFSNMIISEHPLDALLPASSTVVGDEDLAYIYSKEYSLILSGAYGDELKQKALNFENFNADARSLFIKDFKTFLEKRTVNVVYDAPSSISTDEVLKKEKRIFLNFINEVLNDEDNVYSKFKDGKDTSMDEFKTLKNNLKVLNGSWDGIEAKIISIIYYSKYLVLKDYPSGVSDFSSYLVKVVKEGKPDQRVELYNDVCSSVDLKKIETDPNDTIYNKLMDLQYRVNVDFFVSASKVIAPKLKKEGKLTFFDYSLYLVEMLQKDILADQSLIKYIRKRHTHFLLDEFQDTDPMQSKMFFYLASSIPNIDIHKCKLIPGALFIVGDPKQSIYRFRGADVASYIDIENLFDKENVIVLSRNFRSTPIMKDYFNKCFSSLFPVTQTSSQSTFSCIPFVEDVSEDGLVEGLYSYEADGGTDPGQVCNIIKHLVHNENFKIKGPKDIEARTIRYNDFMIIPYGKGSIKNYLVEFEKQNIPFVVEGNVTFSKCSALQDIYYIISYIIKPLDPLSLYKALTCKTIGINSERLLNTGFKKFSYNIFNYEDEIIIKDACYKLEDKIIIDELKKIKELYDLSINYSASSLFKKILETYKIFSNLSSDYLEYLYYTIELLKSKEKDGKINTLIDALAFLESLLKEESGIERCISLDRNYDFEKDSTFDHSKVKIANLHKVKGLEASIVILIYSYNKPKTAKDAFVRKENKYYFFESSEQSGTKTTIYYKTNENYDIKEKENVFLEEEKLRMLYVAATRARCALIISSYKNETQSKWFSLLYGTYEKKDTHSFSPKSIFDFIEKNVDINNSKLDDNLLDEKNNLNIIDLYNKATSSLINTSSIEVISPTYKTIKPSLINTDKQDDFDVDIISNQAYISTLKDLDSSSIIGTLVHKMLQKIIDSKDSYKKEDLIKELVGNNLDILNINLILSNVFDKIHSGGYIQKNGAPNNILSVLLNAIECYTEVPFSYYNNDKLVYGVIDVLYKDINGYHIIDYKTNIKSDGLDILYEQQLDAYVDAVKQILNIDANAFIYHIEI